MDRETKYKSNEQLKEKGETRLRLKEEGRRVIEVDYICQLEENTDDGLVPVFRMSRKGKVSFAYRGPYISEVMREAYTDYDRLPNASEIPAELGALYAIYGNILFVSNHQSELKAVLKK